MHSFFFIVIPDGNKNMIRLISYDGQYKHVKVVGIWDVHDRIRNNSIIPFIIKLQFQQCKFQKKLI